MEAESRSDQGATSKVESPLVSVIIPTFNRAHCLARAIDTGAAANVPRSRSGGRRRRLDRRHTRAAGTTLRRSAARPVHLSRQRRRQRRRNTGIQASRGDFVALLDSDDLWHPWKLQVQVAALQFLPHAGMVWSDMEAIDPEGRVTDPRYLRKMYQAYRWFDDHDLFTKSYPLEEVAPDAGPVVRGATLFEGEISSQMLMGNLVHTLTVLLRRQRLEKAGEFNVEMGTPGEDYEFYVRVCREGPVAFVDLATTQYQTGCPDQLTQPRYFLSMARNFSGYGSALPSSRIATVCNCRLG